MRTLTMKTRPMFWFGVGAVLTLVATLVVVDAWRADAAPGDGDTTFVPVTPCRLIDTRPARIGPLDSFGANDTETVKVHGTNGNCTIPADAVGVSLNVTAVGATAPTFLTIWPDGTLPKASSLNPFPGEPPTPNAVTTDLSPTGSFNIYNLAGTVNVIVDVNGYHMKSSLQEIQQRLLALEAANLGPRIAALEAIRPMVLVEHAESGNVDEAIFGGASSANVLTVTINAPATGDLVVAATVDVGGPFANSLGCQIVVDGAFVPGSVMFTSVGDPGNGEGICATTVTKAVAGGSHTVAFHVRNRASEALDDAALSVVWVRNV